MKHLIGLVIAVACLAALSTPAHAATTLQVETNWPGSPHPDIPSAVDAAAESGDETWGEQDTYLMNTFELEEADVEPPTIETVSASDVTSTSATLAGDLTSDGGAPTTVHACWGEDLVNVLPITVDTYIDSSRPTNNYGANGSAKVVASSSPARTLFMLPEDLWTNDAAQIVSATVSFYVWNDNTGSQEFRLYPLSQAFTEDGATWNTRDGSNAWTTAGGDFDATNSVMAVKGVPGVYASDPNGKFFTWDITALLTNPATRTELQAYGALLDAGTANPSRFASFNSSDKTGYPQAYLPALTLVRANGAPDQTANLGVLAEGAFTHAVSGLRPNTSYSFTFLASNAAGAAWAPAAGSFATLAAAPAIEVAEAADVTSASATLAGDLTSDGGAPTTVHACWGEDLVDVLPITVDTYIDSFRPTNNYGANGSAKVVASTTPARTLFTLPTDLWTNDPAQIVSATVSFYVWSDNTGSQEFRLYPLSQAFTEDGATWNTCDGSNAWTAPGGDYDAANSVLAAKGAAGVYGSDPNGKFFTWDITALLTNPATRAELQAHGALLDAGTANPSRFASFNSSDNANYPQAYLPALTLVRANGAPDQTADLGVLAEGAFTHTVSGLRPNTSYSFTFLASNAAGAAWAPAAGSFATPAAVPAIENAAASDLLDQSATLNATLTSDGGLPTFVSYAFGTDPASWTVTALAGARPEGGVSAGVGGLAPATTYYFQFMASNATGAAWASATNHFTSPYGVSAADISFVDGALVIEVAGLSANVTNAIERAFDLQSNDWTVVTNIVGAGVTNWVEEPNPDWTNLPVFYRIRLVQ